LFFVCKGCKNERCPIYAVKEKESF
jgi:hypothetical protein